MPKSNRMQTAEPPDDRSKRFREWYDGFTHEESDPGYRWRQCTDAAGTPVLAVVFDSDGMWYWFIAYPGCWTYFGRERLRTVEEAKCVLWAELGEMPARPTGELMRVRKGRLFELTGG